ncbi:MAG: prolipoprotein diacylglyceryl transferase [Aestuariivita sp.]|nr:prolipoprotein diacylglyceryl transferase [Aestuariivita sp.]
MFMAIPFPSISPEIFSFSVGSFEFALRWYALAYVVGMLLGWLLAIRAVGEKELWPARKPVMTRFQVGDFLTWSIIGVIFGGRLGYVFFYQPGYYLQNPAEILAVWQGGMSFHGGLLGVVLATWIYTHRLNLDKRSASDLIALCIPPGLFLGRIANFINAELWGRPTSLPWGVIFPGEAAQDCPFVQTVCARHPSQLYEAMLEGLILGGLLIWLAWKRGALRRSGVIAGTFFTGYGIARVAIEFFRQPDPQFISTGNSLGFAFYNNGYGLTMGQLLSIPMIALGVWFIASSRVKT